MNFHFKFFDLILQWMTGKHAGGITKSREQNKKSSFNKKNKKWSPRGLPLTGEEVLSLTSIPPPDPFTSEVLEALLSHILLPAIYM